MKKIYLCEIRLDIYTLAGSEDEARDLAQSAISKESHNALISAYEIRNILAVQHKDWINAIPWGEEGDRTIKEIFRENKNKV